MGDGRSPGPPAARTLDANGTCPECGRAYEHDAVRAQWRGAERRLERGKGRDATDEPSA